MGQGSPAPWREGFAVKFKVVLYEEQEGGYSVEVPALPGCFSEGDTLEDALANIKEAIECHLDASPPSPLPPEALVREVEV
jgi:predicted RNase H-like HicB family nuclease